MALVVNELPDITMSETPSSTPQFRRGLALSENQKDFSRAQMTDLQMCLSLWSGGRDTALDFTVVNPLQEALVSAASEDGSSAVEHAHNLKLRKYEERCAGEGITFLPMAVDTLVGWHPEALDIISRLGR